MGAYSIEAVIEAWRVGKITPEQAIGQILLIVQVIEARLIEVEKRVRRLPARRHGADPSPAP